MKPAGMIVVPLMIYSVMITPFRMKTDMEFLWDVNSEEVELKKMLNVSISKLRATFQAI